MVTSFGKRYLYSGHVQGVGFRHTVKQLASGYEITGWVRNLMDGRVEMQVFGLPGEVESFVMAIKAGQLGLCIKDVEEMTVELSGNACNNFEIRH